MDGLVEQIVAWAKQQPEIIAMMAMVSFWNRLVHLYWAIDIERLYGYLQTDIVLLNQFHEFGLALLQVDE